MLKNIIFLQSKVMPSRILQTQAATSFLYYLGNDCMAWDVITHTLRRMRTLKSQRIQHKKRQPGLAIFRQWTIAQWWGTCSEHRGSQVQSPVITNYKHQVAGDTHVASDKIPKRAATIQINNTGLDWLMGQYGIGQFLVMRKVTFLDTLNDCAL